MHLSRFSSMAPTLIVIALSCLRQLDSSRPAAGATSSGGEPSVSAMSRTALPAAPRVNDPIGLKVVYPAPTDLVRVRDSSFLFGSVANGDVRLTINGARVRVWPNGAWLAWVPFPRDTLM